MLRGIVTMDIDDTPARPKQSIPVVVPRTYTPHAVSPGPNFPANEDTTQDTYPVVVDQHREGTFYITEQQAAQIRANELYIPPTLSAVVSGLVSEANAYVMGKYTGFHTFAGTGGTTPFGSAVDLLNEVYRKLDQNDAPTADRALVVNFLAAEKLKNLADLKDADKAGGTGVKVEGMLGRAFGFDIYTDGQIPLHTRGTHNNGYLVNNASGYAIGDKSILLDTGTGTFAVGDVIVFGGHTQTYAVAAVSGSAPNLTITLNIPLVAAVANNETVQNATGASSAYRNNLAFTPGAIAMVIRPPVQDVGTPGSKVGDSQVYTDPDTGLSMLLRVVEQHHQTSWYLSWLYGAAVVRPQLGARIAGEST